MSEPPATEPNDPFNLNEWLFDEYIRVKDALADLTRRHEEIVNHLADVCRRNDRMQAAGDYLAAMLNTNPLPPDEFILEAIQKWGEANV